MPPRGRKPRPAHIKLVTDEGDTRPLPTRNLKTGLCGALKDDGRTCGLTAGWGTKHKGEGFCKHHEADGRRRVEGCPIPLHEKAAGVWNIIAEELKTLGIFKTTYFPTIAALCSAISVQADATEQLLDAGLLATGYRGDVKKHPIFQIWRDANTQVRLLSAELGLTPTALSRAGVTPGAGSADEMEDLLTGGA